MRLIFQQVETVNCYLQALKIYNIANHSNIVLPKIQFNLVFPEGCKNAISKSLREVDGIVFFIIKFLLFFLFIIKKLNFVYLVLKYTFKIK